MEQLEGSRTGSCVYLHKGFLYLKNKTRNKVTYFRCRENQCSVTASVNRNSKKVHVSDDHGHSPPVQEVEELRLRSELRRAVQRDKRPVRKIFEEVLRRFPHCKLEFSAVTTQMWRARHQYLQTSELNIEDESGEEEWNEDDECSLEVEFKESVGAVNIEGGPCASTSTMHDPCVSTSTMQFAVPEVTLEEEPEFGTERQMSYVSSTPVPTPDETPAPSQDVDIGGGKKIQTGNTLADIVQTTDSTISASGVKVKPIDTLQSKDTSNKEGESKNKEDVQTSNIDISVKTLESVIQRLESVSNKLTVASLTDSYDQFGKYISSVLRGLPIKKVHSLKQKIISEVMETLAQEDSGLPKNAPQHTQANAAPNVRSNLRFVTVPSRAANIPQDPKTYGSKIPIPGNMPLIYPSIFTPTSSLMVPQVPMVVASMGSAATMNVPPSFVGIRSTNTIPRLDEDALKNVDDGFVAATAPKPTLSLAFGSDQSSLQSPRGRKRRKTTATYMTKKAPSPCETSTHSVTTSGDESSRDDQPPGTQQGENTERDFEMDFEEGGELARIKEDQCLFETVLCGEGSSFYIKEEAPDPEELPERNLATPPSPSTNPLTVPATCHLCNAKCNSREDLVTHITSTHPDMAQPVQVCMELPERNLATPPPPSSAPTTCHLCNAKCNSREDLVTHITSTHPDMAQPVQVCMELPERNLATPPPPSSAPTTCHLCNAKCNSREDLITHITSAHQGCVASPCPTNDVAGGGYFKT